jgi:signal peptidase I
MFRSRSVKHARLLIRHAEKLVRYRCDVLSETALADIRHQIEAVERSIKQRDLPGVRENSERLDALVAEHSPSHREASWRENCEVILVAIVVAVGVRSYFIQPFKIPTGSMQPTLNGIQGFPYRYQSENEIPVDKKDRYEKRKDGWYFKSYSPNSSPNLLRQVAEFFILGRNYINVVAPEDESVREIVEQKYLFFFTWSRIITDRGTHRVYAPEATLAHDFQVAPGARYQRGQVIARGAIDTGDQVFVDKFSYNFTKPHRGDVFVFRTKHIPMIPEDPQTGAPYFIKRLVGLPGDTLRISPPLLYVNGEPPRRFGFQRVMQAKPPYRGYTLGRQYLARPDQSFTVPQHSYFAMGDNSYFSYDSRYWGPVPEENLVGRGLWVYWPFNQHWRLIR